MDRGRHEERLEARLRVRVAPDLDFRPRRGCCPFAAEPRETQQQIQQPPSWIKRMNRRIVTAFIVFTFGLVIAPAHAGPCSYEIAQFELAMRQSAGNPNAGPMAPQSVAAQIDRQPTTSSVKLAKKRAQVKFAATLARAKRLDVRGNRAGCARALATAKAMYNL